MDMREPILEADMEKPEKPRKLVFSKCVSCKRELSSEERHNPICPGCGKRWDGGFMRPDDSAVETEEEF
jgi:predicted amidophosphoribosyltransferase